MRSFMSCSPSLSVSPSCKSHPFSLSLLKRDGYLILESQRKGGLLKRGPSFGSLRLSAGDIGKIAVNSRRGSINLVSFCYIRNPSPDGRENVDFDLKVHAEREENEISRENGLNVEIASPNVPVYIQASRMNLGDQAFFLLSFVACTVNMSSFNHAYFFCSFSSAFPLPLLRELESPWNGTFFLFSGDFVLMLF